MCYGNSYESDDSDVIEEQPVVRIFQDRSEPRYIVLAYPNGTTVYTGPDGKTTVTSITAEELLALDYYTELTA